ncbi:MAG: hypothetical protein ABI670_13305 [Chloroflexota bacterium]
MHPSSQPRNQRGGMRHVFLLLAILSAFTTWTPTPTRAAAATEFAARYILPAAYAVTNATTAAPDYQIAGEPAIPASAEVSEGRQRYFTQTAHFLRGAFLEYWETHGATPVLGLPITEPIVEDGLAVQYLERVRLEYHPELTGNAQNKVLLTRLGVTLAEQRGLSFTSIIAGNNTPTSVFFTETGHNLANAFLSYWQRNGGLAVFGYPISEEFVETNAGNGQQYTVQYFERNRFEWHPELPAAFNIQLGLLGVEYARTNGLDPVARIMLPSPLPATDAADLSDDPLLVENVDTDLLPAVQALGRTEQFRWVPGILIENDIKVEFTNIEDEGVGGAFVITRSRSRPYVIVIPERQRGQPIEALASVLAHEATHAYDFINGVQSQRSGCSIEEELRAYKNGLAAWVVLKGEAALADRYKPNTFESNINRSLVGFNNGRTQLGFDIDLDASRAYLSELYGPSCGR